MKLDKAIKKRKSVRRFKSKKPDWREILEAIDSMKYAPKAGDNFCLKTILVSEKEKINKLSEASQQDFVSQAKYIVVVCGNRERMENLYGERGKIYLKQQAGAAIENFLLSIEDKGLSTCWVGHFVNEQVKHILNIPEKYEVEAIFPVGYENEKGIKKEKTNIELSRFIYFEKYGRKKMNEPNKIY